MAVPSDRPVNRAFGLSEGRIKEHGASQTHAGSGSIPVQRSAIDFYAQAWLGWNFDPALDLLDRLTDQLLAKRVRRAIVFEDWLLSVD